MKSSRKIVSFLLCVVLIVTLLPVSAYANQSRYYSFSTAYAASSDPAVYITNIAKAQAELTEQDLGYSEPWCDNFISDCAILAGQEKAIPQAGDVNDFLSKLLAAGAKYVSSIQAGDIVIYKSSNGNCAHTALITDSSGGSIQGNLSHKVVARNYKDVASWNGWPKYVVVRPAYTLKETTPTQNLSNEQIVWNFFKQKGYNDYGVAGIMGNIEPESGFNPINLQNSYEAKLGKSDSSYTAAVDNGSYSKDSFIHDSAGYGLIQWTYWSRKQGLYNLAKNRGTSIGDIITQLEYLNSELQSYGLAYYIANAGSVYEGANIMMLKFVKPGNQSAENQQRRADIAQKYYNKFSGSGSSSFSEIPSSMYYTVTFNPNGGTMPQTSIKVLKGSSIKISDYIPTKEGYKLEAWASFEGSAKFLYPTDVFTPTKDITLEASWLSAPSTCKVTFNLDGGTGDFPALYCANGGKVNLYSSVPHKDGYIFSYWSRANVNTGASYSGTVYLGEYKPGEAITEISYDTEMTANYIKAYKINIVSDVVGNTSEEKLEPVSFDLVQKTAVSWSWDENTGYTVSKSQPDVLSENITSYSCAAWDYRNGYQLTNFNKNDCCSYTVYGSAEANGTLTSDVNIKIEGKAHAWDEGVVFQAPTALSEGILRYTCSECHKTKDQSIPALGNPFADVVETEYYFDGVLWAVDHNITSGVNENSFAPLKDCTRAQIVTFLWRAAGCPEPKSTVNPFTDVKSSDYFFKAVLWAVEQGITNGLSPNTFGPQSTCTRAQTVTFLWRAKGQPSVPFNNTFKDIDYSAYYANAVLWAVNNKITTGTSGTTFSPNSKCTRGQIVTFLYRTYQ